MEHRCSKCESKLPAGRILCNCGTYTLPGTNPDGTEFKDESILFEDIVSADVDRMVTGHWDENFGAADLDDGTPGIPGIVRGSVNLVAGEPGAGKSTLFLQMAYAIIQAFPEGQCLYLASEEQLPQIKARGVRLKLDFKRRLRFLDLRKGVEDITNIMKSYPFIFMFLDSLAAIAEDNLTQIAICKTVKEYASFKHAGAVISHHVNKGDDIAGLKKLQHEVDATMTFFSLPEFQVIIGKDSKGRDKTEAVRELETRKNRNGNAWVRTYYAMTGKGLVPHDDPFGPDGKQGMDDYFTDNGEDEEPESEPKPKKPKKKAEKKDKKANPRISKKGKKNADEKTAVED